MHLLMDTETTGLPDFKRPADAPGQPRVCSLAAALVDDEGHTVEDFYMLVRPEGWREDVIEKAKHGAFTVNGLSMERLHAEGRPIVEVLTAFDAFVDRCEGIAAYGIAFDQKMLRAEQRIAGRSDRYGERPTFCVQGAATKLCGIKKTPKLGEAVQILLGQSLEGAHDALVDLRATVAIFNIMRRDGLVVWKPQGSEQ